MEPLSLRLFFTLTVLLAVLFSAASTAANENEITKHKATESRDVVEEKKLRVQSLKNSSAAAERLVFCLLLLRFTHGVVLTIWPSTWNREHESRWIWASCVFSSVENQSEPLINSVKEFTWLEDALNKHAIDNPEEIASMVDE
ncbi:hypothetical protein DEO72_LG10g2863 [Vigna unguiculata]|uniref:Uncharacterized protein n=1 Tax=Vigna unguiculata TaxID=3917 RepID=A0A4D6NE51_VIGUN|nr:hypothetical protein DEO72_LG10g2863 [Vigna unguiculata]